MSTHDQIAPVTGQQDGQQYDPDYQSPCLDDEDGHAHPVADPDGGPHPRCPRCWTHASAIGWAPAQRK